MGSSRQSPSAFRRRSTICESQDPWPLDVIASPAKQSTVPPPPTHRFGRLVRSRQKPLKLLLHDRFWDFLGGVSRGEMGCFATLAMTESAGGPEARNPALSSYSGPPHHPSPSP